MSLRSSEGEMKTTGAAAARIDFSVIFTQVG